MKRALLCILIVLFVALFVVGCNSKTPTKESSQNTSSVAETNIGDSADWVEYGSSMAGVHEYNKVTIKRKTDTSVQVWSRLYYSDEGKQTLLQNIKNDTGSIPQGWDKVSNATDLIEINCKENSSRLLSTVIYDIDGRSLLDNPRQDPTADIIVPDSMMDYLRKEICK